MIERLDRQLEVNSHAAVFDHSNRYFDTFLAVSIRQMSLSGGCLWWRGKAWLCGASGVN